MRLRMNEQAARTLVAVLTGMLLWTGSIIPVGPGFDASSAQDCPENDSPTALEQVLSDPDRFIGCRITVQGTLYRRQGVQRIHYTLESGSGQSLEVWPWAPEEAAGASEHGSGSEEGDRTMASYIGQTLRIEGRIVPSKQGGAVLEASIVEEARDDPG